MRDWCLYIITVCLLLLTMGLLDYLKSATEYYQTIVKHERVHLQTMQAPVSNLR